MHDFFSIGNDHNQEIEFRLHFYGHNKEPYY